MKWELLRLGTASHVSTICLPDAIARDQISQAFPMYIFPYQILEVGNGLGTRLYTISIVMILRFSSRRRYSKPP